MQRTRRTPLSGSTGTEPPAAPGADADTGEDLTEPADLESAGSPSSGAPAGSSSGSPSSGAPQSGDVAAAASADGSGPTLPAGSAVSDFGTESEFGTEANAAPGTKRESGAKAESEAEAEFGTEADTASKTEATAQSGTTAGRDGDGSARSWRMPALFGAVGLVVLALDQLTKILALHYLEPGDPVDVIGSVLRFQLIRNSGAAFSLGSDYTPVISVIQITVAAGVVWLSRRLGSTGWAVAFGLLFGGAVGNITDRIFREPAPFRGHVVDFLQLPHWAIFNVADMAVTSAAILLIVQTLRGIRLDGTRESDSSDGRPDDVEPPDTEPRDGGSAADAPGDGSSRDGSSRDSDARGSGSRDGGPAEAAAR